MTDDTARGSEKHRRLPWNPAATSHRIPPLAVRGRGVDRPLPTLIAAFAADHRTNPPTRVLRLRTSGSDDELASREAGGSAFPIKLFALTRTMSTNLTMSPIELDPALPAELEREIFEIAARIHLPAARSLVQVATRVRVW